VCACGERVAGGRAELCCLSMSLWLCHWNSFRPDLFMNVGVLEACKPFPMETTWKSFKHMLRVLVKVLSQVILEVIRKSVILKSHLENPLNVLCKSPHPLSLLSQQGGLTDMCL